MKAVSSAVLAALISIQAHGYDFAWVTTFPGSGSGAGPIAIDTAGNTFVAGGFSGTVTFGTNEVTSAGAANLFVTKLNQTGGVVWVRQFGGATSESVMGVVAASDGSIFAAGTFTGTITVGTNTITSVSSNSYPDAFLVKMNAAGEFTYVRTFPLQAGFHVAIALANDRVWLTGQRNFSLFFRSYDWSGNVVDDIHPTTSTSTGQAIVVGSNGNIYVTGSYDGVLNLSTTNLTHPSSINAHFTAAFRSNGVPLWATQIDSSSRSFGNDITLAPDGTVITVGHIDVPYIGAPYPTLFVMKHSAGGELVWSRQQGAHRSVYSAQSVAVDGEGYIYTAGHKVDSYLSQDPRSGLLITAWTSAGVQSAFLRAVGSNPTETAIGNGIVIDPNGGAVVAGSLHGTFTFGTNVVSSPNSAGFVARVRSLTNPPLKIAYTTNGARVSWPSAASGFVLQERGSVSDGPWTNQGSFPSIVGDQMVVVTSTTNGQSFYRLALPPPPNASIR